MTALWTFTVTNDGLMTTVLRSPRFTHDVNFLLGQDGTLTLLSSCCAHTMRRAGARGELLSCSKCGTITPFTIEQWFPLRHDHTGRPTNELVSIIETTCEPLIAEIIASEFLALLFPTAPASPVTVYDRARAGLASEHVI